MRILWQKWVTRFAVGLMGVAWCMPADAQDDENLGGDAYFEFAFRDEPNIIAQGTVGDKPLKSAQKKNGADDETADSSDGADDETADGADDETADSSDGGRMTVDPAAADEEAVMKGAQREESNAKPRNDSNIVADIIADLPGVEPGRQYRISDLTLNCTNEFCREKKNVEALLRATGLELGHETALNALIISVARLRKTGYFSNIRQNVEVSGDRIKVGFDTVPHTRIRKIVIDESGDLYESEVRKRMILRPGAALYPRTALLRGRNVDLIPKEELIDIALKDQSESLRRIYVKDGFFDAKVTIETEEIEENVVDLHVKVDNAQGYVLGQIYIRGHHVRSYGDIESDFRSQFSFFGNVKKAEIEDAVDALVVDYRERGYFQSKIDFVSRRNPETRSIDIFLDITEGEKWVVEYEGNKALDAKELDEAVTFKNSGYVDNGEVESSAEALVAAYVSAGYYYAKARGEILRHGAGDASSVIFHIEEGVRVEIGEIAFDGASVMTRDELLDVISSHEYSAFGSGAYPQRAMIADDAAKIVDAYRERGYLSADVTGWTLETMEQSGRLRLTFIMREGRQSHFSSRQVRYTDREQYDKFDIKIDEPADNMFSDYTFRAERAAITKQLRARGHATVSDQVHCTSYAPDGTVASEDTCEIAEFSAACMPEDLEAMCSIVETRNGWMERCRRHFDTEYGIEGEPACRLKDGITGTEVDVEYEITLGPKFAFGDTFVHGNVETRDWVVAQDIAFDAGEIFDLNSVIESRSLLRRRSTYKSAALNTIGVDDGLTPAVTSGDSTSVGELPVPVVVNLEEGVRRWIDFALGISLTGGDWILTGEMEFVEANLLGTGWELRLLVMPEARFFNDANEFVFVQKFNQNFFALLTLSIPVIPESGFNIVTQLFYDLRYIPDTNKEEYGWLLELQWNLSKQWYAALAFELESANASSFGVDVTDDLSDYHACYPVTFFMDCPFADKNDDLTVALTPRVSYDGRDNPVTPKYGFYAEAKVKLAYSNSIGFYAMPEARVSYVYTFLKHFSAAFNLRFGVSFHEEKQKIPLIDRYFLGGLNMRGYDNEALGPRLVNSLTPDIATNEAGGGEVLFNFTAELRYPIWADIGLYGAIFLDMGALLEHQPTYYSARDFGEALFADEMRYTAGLGLRWQITEAIPPIVIDYGFILNRRRGDPLGNFSLNIGYSF